MKTFLLGILISLTSLAGNNFDYMLWKNKLSYQILSNKTMQYVVYYCYIRNYGWLINAAKLKVPILKTAFSGQYIYFVPVVYYVVFLARLPLSMLSALMKTNYYLIRTLSLLRVNFITHFRMLSQFK